MYKGGCLIRGKKRDKKLARRRERELDSSFLVPSFDREEDGRRRRRGLREGYGVGPSQL